MSESNGEHIQDVPKVFDATPEDAGAMLRASLELTKLESAQPESLLQDGKIRREFEDPKTMSLSDHSESLVDNVLKAYDYDFSHAKDYLVNQYQRYKTQHAEGKISDEQLLMFRRLMQSAHGKLAYQAISAFTLESEKKMSAAEASQKAADVRRSYVSTEEYLSVAKEYRQKYEDRISTAKDSSRERFLKKVQSLSKDAYHGVKRKLTYRNISRAAVVTGRLASIVGPAVVSMQLHSAKAQAERIQDILSDSPSGYTEQVSAEEIQRIQNIYSTAEPSEVPEATVNSDQIVDEDVQNQDDPKEEPQDQQKEEPKDEPEAQPTPGPTDIPDSLRDKVENDNSTDIEPQKENDDDTEYLDPETYEDEAQKELEEFAETHPEINDIVQKAVLAKEGREGVTLDKLPELYALKGVTPEKVLSTINAILDNFGDLGDDVVKDFIALSIYEASTNPDSTNGKYVGILQVSPNHLTTLPQFKDQYGSLSFDERHEALKNPELNAAVSRALYDRHNNEGLNPYSQWHPAWVPGLREVLSRPYQKGDNEAVLAAKRNA